MYSTSDLDLLGLNETIGLILMIVIVGGIILTILGLLYAIRTWMAQSAAFQTRKDVAEIKRMLQDMNRPAPAPTPPAPTRKDPAENGPKLADDSITA